MTVLAEFYKDRIAVIYWYIYAYVWLKLYKKSDSQFIVNIKSF